MNPIDTRLEVHCRKACDLTSITRHACAVCLHRHRQLMLANIMNCGLLVPRTRRHLANANVDWVRPIHSEYASKDISHHPGRFAERSTAQFAIACTLAVGYKLHLTTLFVYFHPETPHLGVSTCAGCYLVTANAC